MTPQARAGTIGLTGDLGVFTDPAWSQVENRPAVVLYDQVPAGIGFSQKLFELHDELLEKALQLVQECPCLDGCPSCVGPAGENGVGGKQETLSILNILTGEKTPETQYIEKYDQEISAYLSEQTLEKLNLMQIVTWQRRWV